MKTRTVLLAGAFASALLAVAAPTPAQQTLPDPARSVIASYETWVPTALGPLPDHALLRVAAGPSYSSPSLGPLPADADVDAIADLGGGVFWFSLADWAELPGGVRAHPGDVVQWNGAGYAKVFDLLACGGPPALNVDAIDAYPGLFGGTILLLSFDNNQLIFGFNGPFVLFDEELVTMNPFSCTIGASAISFGAPGRRLDVDAVASLPRWGSLFDRAVHLSFDSWAALGSYRFGPGDIAVWRSFPGAWEAPVYVDGFGTLPSRELDGLAVALSGVFADGVESSDTSRWSSTGP